MILIVTVYLLSVLNYWQPDNIGIHNKNIKIKTFSDANKLFIEKRYKDALRIYLQLAKTNQEFVLYANNAIMANEKSMRNNQIIVPELSKRIKSITILMSYWEHRI